jgi:nicotinamide riboside kinase
VIPEARAHYLRHVALEGPESTGKSTLALHLARRGGFTYAPEWAKGYIEHTVRIGRDFVEADLLDIARGQTASERALERSADRVVVHDSTLLTTMVWGLFRYGRIDPRIERAFEAEEERSPRMRWILTPETPFVPDVHRNVAEDPDRPETRERFLALMLSECNRRGLAYRMLPGGHEAKRVRAEAWMDEMGPPAMPSPDGPAGPRP